MRSGRMSTNKISIVGMGLFCAVITGASSPVPFTAYDFEATPTGMVATLEFETESDRLYSIERSENLHSNDWSTVAGALPGTGSNIVYQDLAPLDSMGLYYKASYTNIPDPELILNEGFEEPALVSGSTNINASGDWVAVGGSQTIQKADWAAEEAGGQGVWMKGWTANLDRQFYQDVSGSPGVEYTLDAGFKFNENFESNGSTLEMAIIWLDGGGSAISTNLLNVNDNLDASEGWKHLNVVAAAPVGTAVVRAWFHWTTDGNIENTSQSSALVDNVSLTGQGMGPASGWGGVSLATRVAAAQYAGLYALADADSIQVHKIDESIVDDVAVAGNNGMAFTASGRQLFISTPDKVQAYNVGTGTLRDFVTGLGLGGGKLGIAHFRGELFVGTAAGDILRYGADLNDSTGSYNSSLSFSGSDTGLPVCGMAVDIQDEMLYVASSNNLYRLNPANSVLTQIAAVSGIESISFGRTFGAPGQGGLLILQNTGAQRNLLLVPIADLQAGGSVSPSVYLGTADELQDIAATACGRLLTAEPVPEMIADAGDTRMDFMEWVSDEFDQNVLLAKNLLDTTLDGMVRNHAVRDGKGWINVASPDAAYWVVCQLIMSDEVNGDPEAQAMVRSIVERHAQLEVNSDGQWYHWYDTATGALSWGGPDYITSCYSTMKGVHLAIRAKEYYPDDPDIAAAADRIIGNLRNQRDYVRDFGRLVSSADDSGPTVISPFIPSPYQEIHLFSELMAASEPMAENGYLDYWRYRENHPYDYTLPNEPIVKTKMAGFWRMYDQATIAFCRGDAAWKQEFKNFYALFAGWTDDNSPDHLTAFSAGPVPKLTADDPSSASAYSADKYTTHPGTVNSFGTVIGFGLHGDTVPVVGAYFAYRDGQRQLMEGSTHAGADLLTRTSYDYPAWEMQTISPTDHQYAGYALGEILAPGSIDRAIANPTYLEPQWTQEVNGDKTIEFSQLIRRQVWGTADGSNWDFLGYQHTPFTVSAASSYTNFAVVGAEGELLEPSSETAVEEDYDVSADFDGTLYVLRAVTGNAGAQLRAQWYDGTSFIAEQTGSPRELTVAKPSAATLLRVALVDGGTPVASDQLSVVLDGAEVASHANQDFELGNLNSWSGWANSGFSRLNAADGRLEGSRAGLLTASVDAADGDSTAFWCDFDISGDPTNTHYIFEQDVLTENLQGSSIRIRIEIRDSEDSEIGRAYFDACEQGGRRTMLSAGLRKRTADFAKLRYLIELTRDDRSAVTAEERVFVDNLRMLKMNP